MSIMADRWIREQAQKYGMIEPFVESQRRDGCISYGLSSYGYDARVADEFKIFTNVNSATVDPKNFDSSSFVDRKNDVCIIPPNSLALARTVEYFRIPKDVWLFALGNDHARCGIIVNVTPLERGWEGHVTLEFSNTTPLPAKIYAVKALANSCSYKATNLARLAILIVPENIWGSGALPSPASKNLQDRKGHNRPFHLI
uniref:Deoxycytidine triphosphate deaminase n=1 Tax=Zymomonas mobilis TaxID=542 RepID=Q9RMF1_ZYMMB|nr:deoxycytidine triphosphate deaminase [Zymomonas mobilis subsp. mobilis ZM4 = ATCC 31821]